MPISYNDRVIQSTGGDILRAKVDCLVNPVNCVGVMGAGLALQVKNKYPCAFQEYLEVCKEKTTLVPGNVFMSYSTENDYDHLPEWIAHFATKDHWKNPSRLEYIAKGLENFRIIIQDYGIKSVAMPRIGCGLGGLDWYKVRPYVEKILKDLPCHISVFPPKYNR